MEVDFAPDLQARLDRLATASGRSRDEFVQDAMVGYLDHLDELRGVLDSRYEDIRSGRVQLLSGEEAFARLRARSKAERDSQP